MLFSKSPVGQPHRILQKMVLHQENSWQNYLTGNWLTEIDKMELASCLLLI